MGPVLDHDFYGQIYISLGEGIIHTLGNCLVTPLDLSKKTRTIRIWKWVKDLRQVDPIHIVVMIRNNQPIFEVPKFEQWSFCIQISWFQFQPQNSQNMLLA